MYENTTAKIYINASSREKKNSLNMFWMDGTIVCVHSCVECVYS